MPKFVELRIIVILRHKLETEFCSFESPTSLGFALLTDKTPKCDDDAEDAKDRHQASGRSKCIFVLSEPVQSSFAIPFTSYFVWFTTQRDQDEPLRFLTWEQFDKDGVMGNSFFTRQGRRDASKKSWFDFVPSLFIASL